MIIRSCYRCRKIIAWFFYFLFSAELFLPAHALAYVHYGYSRERAYVNNNFPENKGSYLFPESKNDFHKNNDQTNAPKSALNNKGARSVISAKELSRLTANNIGGPSQPEMQQFQSVNSNNMVDLFSGDFSYNIPLMDVGGYPVNLSYRSGISMDQEASWVGLGWNINPGTITRNMRGLPDDFSSQDSVTKISGIKTNKTIGVNTGLDVGVEVDGFPISGSIGFDLGIFHNNYKGWGIENGMNASINAGAGSSGSLSGGLSLSNNSQNGLTITPSLSIGVNQRETDEHSGYGGSLSLSLPYNSRSGLKSLQMSVGVRENEADAKNQKGQGEGENNYSGSFGGSLITFASPSFTPTITMPLSSVQFTFTAKVGGAITVVHPNFSLSGYVSKQGIAPADTLLSLPAYGYLHYQDGAENPTSALLDFNREKELVYRDKPPVPHIALPVYTYDAFSITGEGTGGMFRAYRGDIGFVHDHTMRTKDVSGRASVDIGLGDDVHAGVDLNYTRAYTQNGPWFNENTLTNVINFKSDSSDYEAVYFRNPGEKSINDKNFYKSIGGDDVVTVALSQPGTSSSSILATHNLSVYHNQKFTGQIPLNSQNTVKHQRDKRTQVISYLTAEEASTVGLSKYIENYAVNKFGLSTCIAATANSIEGSGTGLIADFFINKNFKGTPISTAGDSISYCWANTQYSTRLGYNLTCKLWPPANTYQNQISVRWTGQIKAPVTGTYTFATASDDGVKFWLDDSLLLKRYNDHPETIDSVKVNLVQGQFYNIKLEYYNNNGPGIIQLLWRYPGQALQAVPVSYLYPPPSPTITVNDTLILERRVNSFRKSNHISEIDVLNNDGRRYVYGIPVYNLKQKEATFAVNGTANGNQVEGIVGYQDGVDNTAGNNRQGKDWYFNSEQTPAYAHSFLLTGILSSDYVDITGDGITDDDLGDAVKIDYSKVSGIDNPYKWRAPYAYDSINKSKGLSTATFNPGLRTYSRDDKGNYVYGEKELWYLHSVQSKTMIATFVLQNRNDLFAIDEAGNKYADGSAKCLKEIDLYNKADLLKNGTKAKPVKVVHFEYDYELCPGVNKPVNSSGKLTLKKVWFTYNGNDKGKQNPYVFYYHPNNPSYNIKSYDRWGNYKDPLQNPGSTAGNLITNAEYPYSLQDSSLAAYNAGAWALDSIYLPSGGSVKVDFESDDYSYVQNKRASQLFKILGLGSAASPGNSSSQLYSTVVGVDGAQITTDNLYVFLSVPTAVKNKTDLYQKYLAGIKKLYFKLFVRMPDDQWGTGSEYVPVYANFDHSNGYGLIDQHTIWIKITGINLDGTEGGSYSPLATAAIQFLRLNLPSKAYPGSEVGDDIDLTAAVKMIFSLADNIKNAFTKFDVTARNNNWAKLIDTSRSFVRLDNPNYKKYGGGHRVKRVTIYDNWDKMTGQRPAKYGQEYAYTTQQEVNGDTITISSGVASYEPGLGGDENPFHQPIEYLEDATPLGPTTMAYSEEPLGESFFPSASVGYSQVTVRTINYKKAKSSTGYDVTRFYTSYDFPTYTDRTVLDNDTKKRYKPGLANFLRINAKYYLTMSQGFKVELNDMNGKMRSQASYPENDPKNPVTYTENIYKVVDPNASDKVLSNTVMAMNPDGSIDTSALIGKDAELMMDMREQQSVTNGNNISVNTDLFSIPFIPPLFLLPSLINLAQREENRFRSAATVKIIQRYGILDSVVHIDKGSKVTTKDVMYDAETGDVILTRTQNEFNDPVYNFIYPAHWAYDGMGLAYKNINVILNNITFKKGKIVGGLTVPDSTLFSSGDELLVGGRQKTGDGATACKGLIATFPNYNKIWAVDSSVYSGGAKSIYFIDADGGPYTEDSASVKIIRSGRRNINSSVGSVTTLVNPLVYDAVNQKYSLVLNTISKVISAKATEFKQSWKVDDIHKQKTLTQINCPQPPNNCYDTIAANYQIGGDSICFSPSTNPAYSLYAFVYGSTQDAIGHEIEDTVSPGFWTSYNIQTNQTNTNLGRLNNTGVWICNGCNNGACAPQNQWIGFTEQVYAPVSDTFFIGMGGDNQVEVDTNGTAFIQLLEHNNPDNNWVGWPFQIWHLYPIYLTKGYHNFTFQGWNEDSRTPASFGAEIYHLARNQIDTASSSTVLNSVIFSTRDLPNSSGGSYSCPINSGYYLDSTSSSQFTLALSSGPGGPYTYFCKKQIPCPIKCDTIYSTSCYSAVTDTTLNPYSTGILGNWRAYKNYTYYGRRAESDPTTATDIRRNGTFKEYSPFWNFSFNRPLQPSYDTTRWVWNSQMTLFSKKGLEIENVDPLGRYNCGLYGYNFSLPTAVVQNAKYRESAFEGFEDYGYGTQGCNTACPVGRHFDFTSYSAKITSQQSHTGKYSLQLNQGEDVGVSFGVTTGAQDSANAQLAIHTFFDTCFHQTVLDSVKAPNNILLPAFTPFKGRLMVLSVWVKENQPCNCSSYINNQVIVAFSGSSSPAITFTPTGNIIDGWQRYENVFMIPSDAGGLTVDLKATGSVTVYFDDLRIEPFKSNMKSFVYNPVNLRLMAELDENNYATLYEYDDDGTLIRVKKETERGIMTIKETRSALIKQ
ncbi:MAG TPA: PA14 domain-containing protein [Puia sp.]|nr:PA14 domain-containing protein [Puia sp.]